MGSDGSGGEVQHTSEVNAVSKIDGTVLTKRKENAVILAAGYTNSKRAMELVSVTLFVVFCGMTFANIYQHFTLQNWWVIASACALSMALADVFSGLVHWSADSWGTLQTPIVGKTFIRSFREHHVDPFRITVHDIVETNGDNCLIVTPPLAILSFVQIDEGNSKQLFTFSFLVLLCVWVSLTNQIHKWAHTRKPPVYISILQDLKVILSRKNHQIHHHNPFDRYYCITTGWLNPILGSIAFWKRMENCIVWASDSKITPRSDDAYWTIQAKSD